VLEGLSARLQAIAARLGGQARITDAVLEGTLGEIRTALLEADVHVDAVRELLSRVREKAGEETVLRSLSPGQQVVRIVRDELALLLGAAEPARLRFASRPPTVIFLVGLQGSGKTTTAAKLGVWLKGAGRYPLLVPADVRRPAAIEQLVRVGRAAGLKVLEHDGSRSPLELGREAILEARRTGFDAVVLDTAGRLHVDEELMEELRDLKAGLEPSEILLVADAMTGQDAVRSAAEFHRVVSLTGVILTKLDGDARGGAALSIRHVTGVPIKFVGTGERPSDLERFEPERFVGRILGFGDVLGLIEKAEQAAADAEARAVERSLRKGSFTLEDLRNQLRMLRKMGPLGSLVSMLPGMGHVREADLDAEAIGRALAILDSMTPAERQNPQILDGSRKKRIARGSGQSVQEVNRLLKQFAVMKRMTKAMGAARTRPGRFRLPFPGR
jgi:signal recognition particle subunit SRP54